MNHLVPVVVVDEVGFCGFSGKDFFRRPDFSQEGDHDVVACDGIRHCRYLKCVVFLQLVADEEKGVEVLAGIQLWEGKVGEFVLLGLVGTGIQPWSRFCAWCSNCYPVVRSSGPTALPIFFSPLFLFAAPLQHSCKPTGFQRAVGRCSPLSAAAGSG